MSHDQNLFYFDTFLFFLHEITRAHSFGGQKLKPSTLLKGQCLYLIIKKIFINSLLCGQVSAGLKLRLACVAIFLFLYFKILIFYFKLIICSVFKLFLMC